MAKKKTGLTLSYSEWNPKKQYKVNESVFIDGVLYQNSNGKNTDPRLLLDWVVIETEIQNNIDSIIVRTGYTIAPNNIIFNSGYVWKILGSQYQLSNSKSFSITPIVTTGNFRIDIIVANQNNDFEKIEGVEGVNTTAPNIPENTLLVESLFISDSGFIIEPTPDNLYVERNEFKFTDYYMSNSGVLNLASNSGYSIVTNSVPLKAVLVANNQMGYLWNGKEYKLKNDTLNDIVIKHLDSTLNGFSYRKFYFPTLTDYTLKPNEIIRFVFVNDRLVFLGSNISSASSDEHYVFNSIISVTGTATANYHYRAGAQMNLNLNTATGITVPSDLISVSGTIVDIISPFKCRLKEIKMYLPNVDGFSLALVSDSSFVPTFGTKVYKGSFNSVNISSYCYIDQNVEASNIVFEKGHGIKLFCAATTATPASKGGIINLIFNKIE